MYIFYFVYLSFLNLFLSTASAMCTLQSKGVVHRDLKPQNLLLHHTGVTKPSPSEIKIKIGRLCPRRVDLRQYSVSNSVMTNLQFLVPSSEPKLDQQNRNYEVRTKIEPTELKLTSQNRNWTNRTEVNNLAHVHL